MPDWAGRWRCIGTDVLNPWRPGEGEQETIYASANVGLRSAWLDPRADRARRVQELLGSDGIAARLGQSPELCVSSVLDSGLIG
ncbi:hypothetical protein GCM10011494_19690 [Novosphingobium endophyticum]|uniref:Uncharacterized protein n=1 Tax=Novosphingobium endophyticum TaxID=1955250 RepID=A0A916TT17_9SPHN|nr:hypothetical protein GCM10011494_19690 [Novosphingobium endophyticum]